MYIFLYVITNCACITVYITNTQVTEFKKVKRKIKMDVLCFLFQSRKSLCVPWGASLTLGSKCPVGFQS